MIYGFEKEGFYDILTGRPRYPFSRYNEIRKARYEARQLPEKRPGNLKTSFMKPKGSAFQIPV